MTVTTTNEAKQEGPVPDARAVIAEHVAALEVLARIKKEALEVVGLPVSIDIAVDDATKALAPLRALLSAPRGTAAVVVEAAERVLLRSTAQPGSWADVNEGFGALRAALAAHKAGPESLGAGAEVAPQTVTYTNWRGETEKRTIRPLRLWHGSTEHHKEPQWIVEAFDEGKNAVRSFALAGFSAGLVEYRAEAAALKAERETLLATVATLRTALKSAPALRRPAEARGASEGGAKPVRLCTECGEKACEPMTVFCAECEQEWQQTDEGKRVERVGGEALRALKAGELRATLPAPPAQATGDAAKWDDHTRGHVGRVVVDASMTPAAILSQIGNTEAAHRATLGSQPGYNLPDFWSATPRPSALDAGASVAVLTAIRDAARYRKEYQTADALREVLASLGQTIKDRR